VELAVYGAVFLAGFCLTLGVGYTLFWERMAVLERLEHYTEERKKTIYQELNQPLSQRVFKPLIGAALRGMKRFVPKEKARAYEHRLTLAGNPHGLEAETFVAAKYGVFAAAVLLGLLTRSPWLLVLLGMAGLLLPDMYLNLCRRQRSEGILKSLPDVLDLLSVSVEAGLGFDAALQKVVEKSQGPLADEFDTALNEIRMGKPRREALRDMARRVEVDDVSTFVGAVVQADTLGVSISNVLTVQAEQVRQKRRQRAEEKAQKAPVKILIPMLFFIFPTIFIVLLGPALLQIGKVFK